MSERYDQIEQAIREHVAAFNSRDVERLMAGLAEDVVWQTGADTIRGRSELAAVFSDAFRVIAPQLTIRSLLIDRDQAACELRERMTVDDVAREDYIAGFYRLNAMA